MVRSLFDAKQLRARIDIAIFGVYFYRRANINISSSSAGGGASEPRQFASHFGMVQCVSLVAYDARKVCTSIPQSPTQPFLAHSNLKVRTSAGTLLRRQMTQRPHAIALLFFVIRRVARGCCMTMSALQLVIAVVEEFGREFEYDYLRKVSAETVLFDGNDGISELCLFSIIAELGHAAQAEFGKRVVLVDECAVAARQGRYRTVGSLASFLEQRLIG